MYSMQLLAKKNIMIPKTMLMKFPFCENHIEILRKEIGYPMIVKTLSGTQGKGVFLVRDRSHLEDLITLVEQTNPNFNMIIQQFIQSSHGRDLRVFTVGGKVVGVMERNACDGGFKANFSTGGKVSPYPVSSHIEWLAMEISRLFNLDISGIDLMFGETEDEYIVCEVNSSPGFKGLESALDVNIPKAVFDYIFFKLNKYPKKKNK
ncbi:MAG: ATP-grasp domain-containing protein, partial [Turicibacter sp.]